MRKTGFLYGALLLVLGTMLVFATTGTAAGTASFKAAWIYVGPHNDGGWSQAHDQGRLYVQKMLGSKVETTYKENVPEGPQVAQVIESLIADSHRRMQVYELNEIAALEGNTMRWESRVRLDVVRQNLLRMWST